MNPHNPEVQMRGWIYGRRPIGVVLMEMFNKHWPMYCLFYVSITLFSCCTAYVEDPLWIQIMCSPCTSAVPDFMDTVLVARGVGFF
jgi:hypothetical protein